MMESTRGDRDAVSQDDLDHQPEPLKGMRIHNTEVDHDSVVLDLDPTHEQRHRQRAYYLANVTMIDEKIGQIIESLDATGYLDNTVIVFTSDHGDCLTDHGHSQKWTMYDPVVRVPMIVWAPGRVEGGRTIDGLCQAMDIGPTILEMAGAPVPEPMAAKSLLPVLRDEAHAARTHVFAEHCRDGNFTTSDYMTMVRTIDWKLVHFLDEPWGQLFDLNVDPKEQQNLWDSAAHVEMKRELLGAIRDWRIRDGYENAAWCEAWR